MLFLGGETVMLNLNHCEGEKLDVAKHETHTFADTNYN